MKIITTPIDLNPAMQSIVDKTFHLRRRVALPESDIGVCVQAGWYLPESSTRLKYAAEMQSEWCSGKGTLSARCTYTWDRDDLFDHEKVCVSLEGEQLSYKELKITCNGRHSQRRYGALVTDTITYVNVPECLPKKDCTFDSVCSNFEDYVADYWEGAYRNSEYYSVSCQATSTGCSTSYSSDVSSGGMRGGAIAGIVLSSIALLGLVITGVWVYRKKKLAENADDGSKPCEPEPENDVTNGSSDNTSPCVAESQQAEDGNVITNDNTTNNTQGKSSAPTPPSLKSKYGIGFLKGWLRDGHYKHTLLWSANIIWLSFWMHNARQGCTTTTSGYYTYSVTCVDNFFWIEMPWLVAFVWMVLFLPFIAEFYFSSTHKYLRNVNTTESLMSYMARLYRTPPTLSITIECYHMETRTIYTTDANGNGQTQTVVVPVVTYFQTENVHIISWEDQSRKLQDQDISEYQVTKVTVTKTFTGDEDYQAQCDSLVNRNKHRDVFHTLKISYNIDGFKEKMLSFVDLKKKPVCLNLIWAWLAHLTLFFALPFRLWMSSVTGKIDINVHKSLRTEWSGRTCLSNITSTTVPGEQDDEQPTN